MALLHSSTIVGEYHRGKAGRRLFDASDGHRELFKTTKKYDGDLGREMHGFRSSAELPVYGRRLWSFPDVP
jgi:hypothetical protein